MSRGVVAAGHPVTAEAGADVLRAGGNAVDAALAAMLASWVAEPALTGPGAGGYMLVAPPGGEPVLLDFFMETPAAPPTAPLRPASVSFGDAVQVFHAGAASCAVYGNPAGICSASERFGSMALRELCAPAARMAREGVEVNAAQAYILEILVPIHDSGLHAGDVFRDSELAVTIERLGEEGSGPFYRGDIAAAVADHVAQRGGALTRADLAAYATVERTPLRIPYRDREVLLNPHPNAGGPLLAHTLSVLTDPSPRGLVAAMDQTATHRASLTGSTTHISVVDGGGMAASVTATNGEGSGEIVAGTGIHLNNAMGEEDLSPRGFFTHPPRTRLPSMMAPTLVLRDGEPELVLGSAGSNRIRSALLQVIVNVIDRGMDVRAAVEAPRLHLEGRTVYAEPGVDLSGLAEAGFLPAPFRARNVFFGGCQAVRREGHSLTGAGDPRRGGAVVSV